MESMDLRINNIEYYQLDGLDWESYAGHKILKLEFKVDQLLATQGDNKEQCELMEAELATDISAMGRQQAVYEAVAQHRLGAHKDPDRYNYGVSEEEIAEAAQNKTLGAGHYLKLDVIRKQAKLSRAIVDSEDLDSLLTEDHLKTLTDTIMFQTRLIEAVTHSMEIARLDHTMLIRDLSTAGAGRGGTGILQKDEPAWWSQCDPTVYALGDTKAMKFESKGVTESSDQKEGRKVRDGIYERFSPLWDEQKYTWAKIPDESKIAIANACGKAPMCWNPNITARRMTSYILFRRSAKGQKKLKKQKDAKAAATGAGKSKKVSHIITLCEHYVHINTKCVLFIT
jgi:hypothetical protein